ncbi:hypothetical protein C0J52_10625 [Blattella germanica]|nr:hypothetical protein C0J52_10625 [Blattella germanica]
MRFLRAVKGCTRLDKLRSADIRTELKIKESAVDKVQKYKTNWKPHINRISGERFPKLTQGYRFELETLEDLGNDGAMKLEQALSLDRKG